MTTPPCANTPPDVSYDTAVRGSQLAQEIVAGDMSFGSQGANPSHLAWLSRECSKLLHRDAELTARAERLSRAEQQMRSRRGGGKGHRQPAPPAAADQASTPT